MSNKIITEYPNYFAKWFNGVFRVKNIRQFPHNLDEENFLYILKNLKMLTGKTAEEITLEEFIGHFCIIYNETGGQFSGIREMGTPQYMFDTIMPNGHTKHSYNKNPNRLAGDMLKDWGVISAPHDIEMWNGQLYPINAPLTVKEKAKDCDFYKFRGYGLCQVTWLNNWLRCIFPILRELYPDKELKSYTDAELDQILVNNKEIAIKSYYLFWATAGVGAYAVEQMKYGNYRPYGAFVSGGWEYYISGVYIPRCSILLNALKEQKQYSIDGMNLVPSQIKYIQNSILSRANGEIYTTLMNAGGADGHWGDVTQWAYELLGVPLKNLLE